MAARRLRSNPVRSCSYCTCLRRSSWSLEQQSAMQTVSGNDLFVLRHPHLQAVLMTRNHHAAGGV